MKRTSYLGPRLCIAAFAGAIIWLTWLADVPYRWGRWSAVLGLLVIPYSAGSLPRWDWVALAFGLLVMAVHFLLGVLWPSTVVLNSWVAAFGFYLAAAGLWAIVRRRRATRGTESPTSCIGGRS